MIPSDTITQNPLYKLLPEYVLEWTTSESAHLYIGEEIFDYMDGAGEIYRAYNFKELLVQRYTCPDQEEILVEIFDMGLSKNAFGIFTYMMGRGSTVKIGQDGEYKSGLLTFWRNNYFVCVKVENENDKAKKAVLKLGEKISKAIGKDGNRSPILKRLPARKYFENSVRYFFSYEILNIHFYVAERNILNLNDSTEGVLVRLKDDKSYLLLVKYTNRAQATSAYTNFLQYYMPDSKHIGIVKTENKKWTACEKHKNYLIINFDVKTKKRAENSIKLIRRRLQ